jgi:hypothetical protein
MNSIGYGSESVGIDRESAGWDPESTGTGSHPAGGDPESGRMGGVSVKEAAQLVGMPVSTMYDWVNRRWVRTIVGLSERGKEQRLVPWSEIERLRGGAKEELLRQSGRPPGPGTGSETTGGDPALIASDPALIVSDPEATGAASETTGNGSGGARNRLESVGIDWKQVARVELRRVRDLTTRIRFLEEHLARAEARAQRAEERAEREGHELRVLIAQSVHAQQQTAAALTGIEARMALPAPQKAPWWRLWRR